MWKEVAVAWFKVMFQYFHGGPGQNHKKLWLGYPQTKIWTRYMDEVLTTQPQWPIHKFKVMKVIIPN